MRTLNGSLLLLVFTADVPTIRGERLLTLYPPQLGYHASSELKFRSKMFLDNILWICGLTRLENSPSLLCGTDTTPVLWERWARLASMGLSQDRLLLPKDFVLEKRNTSLRRGI